MDQPAFSKYRFVTKIRHETKILSTEICILAISIIQDGSQILRHQSEIAGKPHVHKKSDM